MNALWRYIRRRIEYDELPDNVLARVEYMEDGRVHALMRDGFSMRLTHAVGTIKFLRSVLPGAEYDAAKKVGDAADLLVGPWTRGPMGVA